MSKTLFDQMLVLCVALCLTSSALAAADTAKAGSAEAAFENLKKLEGVWTGTNARGDAVEVDYAITGGGTTLMERFRMGGDHGEMLTVYHLDGESILLTHYCSIGNQPRMRATEFGKDGELRFDFVDVSGVASADEGHMHHAMVRYAGGDRMSSDWTFREKGEDQFTETVAVTRAE